MDLALQDPSVRGPDVEKICDVSGMVALGLVLQEGQSASASLVRRGAPSQATLERGVLRSSEAMQNGAVSLKLNDAVICSASQMIQACRLAASLSQIESSAPRLATARECLRRTRCMFQLAFLNRQAYSQTRSSITKLCL